MCRGSPVDEHTKWEIEGNADKRVMPGDISCQMLDSDLISCAGVVVDDLKACCWIDVEINSYLLTRYYPDRVEPSKFRRNTIKSPRALWNTNLGTPKSCSEI